QVGRWRGFFDLSYTHNRNHWVASEFWEPAGGWAAAFESGAYDPFVDMRVTSPASDAAFYRDYVARRDFRSSATRSYQAAIKASGPVFDLPAGAAQLTAGLEGTRSDRYYSYAFTQYQDGLTGAPRVPVSASSDVILAPDYNPLRRFMF